MIPVIETALGSLISGIVNRFFPNKSEEEKQKIAAEMQSMALASELAKAQLEVNKAEASNPNLFVSGARPFIMWGLGGCLVLYYILVTITNVSVAWGAPAVPMPPLDPTIRDIVLGLLGLGWVSRSYEKVRLNK